MSLKHEVRKLLWKAGYDVSRFEAGSHAVARRRRLLQAHRIGVVLDVGANDGQYGEELRTEHGFRGHIRSFEPVAAPFRQLEARASRDPRWEVFDFALGDAQGVETMNVAGNSYSSSLLEMLPAHEAAAPESKYVSTEEIRIETLDSIFDAVCPSGERVYLKVDTQGFEGRVLEGARQSLSRIELVQLEMPLTPLYEGESSFIDLHRGMLDEGYALVGLETGFNDPATGRVLQVDGIFHRG